MKNILKLFTKNTTKLYNGCKVSEGDVVEFINSDGQICRDVIRKREKDDSLYFWNSCYGIESYRSAYKVEPIDGEKYPVVIDPNY
jgi:hypothetical protein